MDLLQYFNTRLFLIFVIILSPGCNDTKTVGNEPRSQINAPNYEADDWSTQNDLYNLKYKAENGDTSAMIELYQRYRFSDGVEKHLLRAISYINKASALGDNEATRRLINIYNSGVRTSLLSDEFEIEKDPVLAKEYKNIYIEQLKNNAEQDAEAGFWLARAYEKGFGGLEIDIQKAQYYYEESAKLLEEKVKNGDMESRLLYAKLKRTNHHPSILQNESVAIDILEQLVTDGHRESHLLLADIYYPIYATNFYKTRRKIHNLTEQQAEARAITLLTNAANKGASEAQTKLVYYYRDNLQQNANAAELVIYWADKAMPQEINYEVTYSILFNAKLSALTAIEDGESIINSILNYYARGKFEDLITVYNTSENIFAAAFDENMNSEDPQIVAMKVYINSLSREERIQLYSSLTEKLVQITKYMQYESEASICERGGGFKYEVANNTVTLMRGLKIDSHYSERLQDRLNTCSF